MPDCYGGHRPCSTAVSMETRIFNQRADGQGRTVNPYETTKRWATNLM